MVNNMYKYNIAYRFNNGEVKGFSATDILERQAKEKTMQKLYNKLNQLEQEYSKEQVIKTFKGLSEQEKEQIKKDWKESK